MRKVEGGEILPDSASETTPETMPESKPEAAPETMPEPKPEAKQSPGGHEPEAPADEVK